MTSGSMVARDLYRPYIDNNPSWKRELLVARLAMLLLSLASLYLATFFETSLVLLGGLAIAFGFQLFPVLLGMLWFNIFKQRYRQRPPRVISQFFKSAYGHSPVTKKNKVSRLCFLFNLGILFYWPRFDFWKFNIWQR